MVSWIRTPAGPQLTLTRQTSGDMSGKKVSTKSSTIRYCRGYATAAACIVASRLQDQGLIPIWSTGVGNPASMAVPAKLGFSEVLPRRFYICFD